MTPKPTSVWLPQVLFESVLIVVSILVALGLDEWRQDREDAEVLQHALANFVIEIRQNSARVDDAAPFNLGLRQVLGRHYQDEDIKSVDQFVNMVGSYSPAGIHSTAWDTALATGSLGKMEYNLVTALSLTYSLQNRYERVTSSGMSDLTSPQNLSQDKLQLAMYNSIRFLEDVTRMEAELSVTYAEATSVIQSAMIEVGNDASKLEDSLVKERAYP